MSRCREFGIATAPALLSVAKGKITALDWSEPGLPEIDLFVKPLHGQNGKNATRWDYLGSGQYQRNDGKHATANEVLEELAPSVTAQSFPGAATAHESQGDRRPWQWHPRNDPGDELP